MSDTQNSNLNEGSDLNDNDDLGLPSDLPISSDAQSEQEESENSQNDEQVEVQVDKPCEDNKSENQKSKITSQQQPQSDEQQSDEISPALQKLYQSSLKPNQLTQKRNQEERLKETHRLAKPNKASIQLANNRNSAVIDSIIGNKDTLTEIEFIRLVKKFNIVYSMEPENGLGGIPSIYSQLSKYCLIESNDNENSEEEENNDKQYDSEKLKYILKLSANGGKRSNLALRMRQKVTAALTNMPMYLMCHSNKNSATSTPKSKQSPKKKQNSTTSTPKRSNTPKTPKGKLIITIHNQNTQNSNSDYDADEYVEPKKEEETPKKETVSPRKSTPKGQKYLPGFYDNLDFYKSPK